jgi:holo-[acyl-carrier protein] synthase
VSDWRRPHDDTGGAGRGGRDPAHSAALLRTLQPLADEAHAAVGVDAVHIPTWAGILARTGPTLGRRVYTDQELGFADGRADRLATRLAAKEAVLKALGTGIRGIGLHEVEVISQPEGAPTVVLHGAAGERHRQLNLGPIAISLCHEEDMAYAVALALPLRTDQGGER